MIQATSRAQIEKCFNIIFINRSSSSLECTDTLISILSLESIDEAIALHEAVLELIKISLSSSSLEVLAQLLEEEGSDINPKLKNLIGQIISSKLEQWIEVYTTTTLYLQHHINIIIVIIINIIINITDIISLLLLLLLLLLSIIIIRLLILVDLHYHDYLMLIGLYV